MKQADSCKDLKKKKRKKATKKSRKKEQQIKPPPKNKNKTISKTTKTEKQPVQLHHCSGTLNGICVNKISTVQPSLNSRQCILFIYRQQFKGYTVWIKYTEMGTHRSISKRVHQNVSCNQNKKKFKKVVWNMGWREGWWRWGCSSPL